jgi:uncharacterized protein YndB with AHSA1/START domain
MTQDMKSEPFDELIKIVHIDSMPEKVWRALTDVECIASWTSNEELSVTTDWQVGGPIVFRGTLHGGKIRFENSGIVYAFEPERLIEYSHWSSLSRRVIPDSPENHVSLKFTLSPVESGTQLKLVLGNLIDPAVRGHIDFHWDVTLPLLKRFCESAD